MIGIYFTERKMFKRYPRLTVSFSFEEYVALLKAFCSHKIFEGEEVSLFEKKFAEFLEAKYAIVVSSGRVALYIILKSLNFPKGSEIIVPAYTYYIVPAIIKYLGYKPIFVDIEYETLNIDIKLIPAKITEKTKAIIPTHMYGQPVRMDEINTIAKKHGLVVIEDASHAFGSKYRNKYAGTLAEISFFSFYCKSPNCYGGGMIVTNSDRIFEESSRLVASLAAMKKLHFLKWFIWSIFLTVGSNIFFFTFFTYPLLSIIGKFNPNIIDNLFEKNITLPAVGFEKRFHRFLNLQAILGLMQLKKITQRIQKRIDNSEYLIERFKACKQIELTSKISATAHSYLVFPVRVKNVKSFREILFKKGIDTKKDYCQYCPGLNIFNDNSQYPVASKVTRHNVFIPNYYQLDTIDSEKISRAIMDAAGKT